jgi:hypothetical protein
MTLPDTALQTVSRTPAEIWTRARADYLAGESAPVVAERHGLSLRSFRRRASLEGWRRTDIERPQPGDAPVWERGLSKADLIELHPELGEIEAVRAEETLQLLFDPTPREFRRFAFRRAAELAATDSPRQALAWMRLVQMLEGTGERIDREGAVVAPVDSLRAAVMRRLDEEMAALDDPEDLPKHG